MAVYVSDLLTAIPAPVDVAPASTTTWQWLRSSTTLSGATGGTYTVTDADLGSALAVIQTETNFLGSASATSANTDVVQAYNPAALFRYSEPGVWFDPNDIGTLYTDTAGTTPVTAPSQTVALMLDKSLGLALGPELVVNGDFSAGTTGWTAGNSALLSASSGELIITNTAAAFGLASQPVVTVIGRSYRVSCIARTISGASVSLQVANSATGAALGGTADSSSTTNTNLSLIFTATAATTFVRGVLVNVSGNSGAFDNISVKELAGNHATQATPASRPTYGIVPAGGRRNLLTFSEQFSFGGVGGWATSGQTVTPNTSVAPDGTTTAETTTSTTAANNSLFPLTGVALAAGPASSSIYVKAGTAAWVVLSVWTGSGTNGINQWFNLQTGDLGARQATAGYTETGGTVTNVGNGWYRITVSGTVPAANHFFNIKIVDSDAAFVFTNIIGDTVLIWGAQLEQSTFATDYQRVGTEYDVTEAGVPSLGYLYFNGINNSMATGTITPGIDKVQVFSGVRKLSDALRGKLIELGVGSGNGWFGLQAPNSNGANTYDFNSLGTSNQTATATGFVAPITNVLTGLADISGQSVSLRANGVVAATVIGSQGTGNYLSYALNIGARAGGSLPFNGQLFPLIVRFGSNLTAARITSTENWMASQTPLQWTVGAGFWNDAYPWSDISAWRD